MNVWSICASISVTITDIWTKFGTEHKYHTINTPEWPNSHEFKIQNGGGRHLEFRKNVNNSGLDTDYRYLHQSLWEHAPRPCGDYQLTKSWNRKLIRETSSSECLEHKCQVDLSDYRRYLNQILYTTELNHHTINMSECSKFTWLENTRWWRPPSWISENINNSELDRELFAQNLVGRCITAMRRWHITTKTRNRNFFRVTSLLWWIKMYILNECREHNRCADVKAYKSS